MLRYGIRKMEQTIFSNNNYVEYISGDMNVIVSVPHGGSLKPMDIPLRDSGGAIGGVCVYNHCPKVQKDPDRYPVRKKKDLCTKEIGLSTAQHINEISGKTPHVIINHLHRNRMDPNCAMEKGCFGNAMAENAWTAYHSFIETAQRQIAGAGLLLDIHGQVHHEDWVELGYAMSQEVLNSHNYTAEMTSVYSSFRHSKLGLGDIRELVCGASSLGALLASEGFDVVPSPKHTSPGECNYYPGGFITEIHGSKNGGQVDAIQVECPSSCRRTDRVVMFSKSLATSVLKYLQLHY